MMQEFVQAVRNTAKDVMNGIHTAFPGEIVSFDPGSCTATVKPSMVFRKPDGTTISYPTISGVPVCMPQGSGQDACIAYPVKAGDGCMIVVAEQSTDYWMYDQETSTNLRFDMSNAMCVPGMYKSGNDALQEACDDDAIIVSVKDTRIKIKDKEILIESEEKIEIKCEKDIKITGEHVDLEGIVKVNGAVIG